MARFTTYTKEPVYSVSLYAILVEFPTAYFGYGTHQLPCELVCHMHLCWLAYNIQTCRCDRAIISLVIFYTCLKKVPQQDKSAT